VSSFYISAAHKSSGKTTLSIGLCGALTQQGYSVQAFKKGPDYIDPLWLGKASGRACYNLDFFTTPHAEIASLYQQKASLSQISLIEGNKGLYDGMSVGGEDSNAAMASFLQVPVILVIDCNGITRGIAPLLHGYLNFTDAPVFAGVILNKVAGPRHQEKLEAAVREYTDLCIIGAVRKSSDMQIEERHLGLIPSNEKQASEKIIARLSALVADQVDLSFFTPALKTHNPAVIETPARIVETQCRIGIFQDAAFGFYYPDDLEVLQKCGAELVSIDALADTALPDVDGIFIGGGFPETHLAELSANHSLMSALREYVENNGVVYAECGGLMYLCNDISWQGSTAKMVGLVPGNVIMSKKPQGRGYIKLAETDKMPWPVIDGESTAEISAHEFHYSRIEGLTEDSDYAYEVLRGTGITGKQDGFIYRNLLANYAHMRNVGNNHWAERFISKVIAVKNSTEVENV